MRGTLRAISTAMLVVLCIGTMAGCKSAEESQGGTASTAVKSGEADTEDIKMEQESVGIMESVPEASGGEKTEEAAARDGKEAGRNSLDEGNMIQAPYPQMAPYPNRSEYFDKKTGKFDNEGFSKVFDDWWVEKMIRRRLP